MHLTAPVLTMELNAWNTKFSQNIVCVCSKQISVNHLFFECPALLQLYEEKSLKIKNFDIVSIFDSDVIVEVVKVISNSPVCNFLYFFFC
jgi:hypothetical protein